MNKHPLLATAVKLTNYLQAKDSDLEHLFSQPLEETNPATPALALQPPISTLNPFCW